MNEVEILTKQTIDAYDWANKLIKSVPEEKWDTIPEILETNLTWQVGHLLLSCYYHSIMVIRGHQIDVVQKMPIKQYSQLFNIANPKNAVGNIIQADLLEHFAMVQAKSIEIISALNTAELQSPLEPTEFPHPIAKIKFEALDWNIKHTMWHCGQIGMLKRVVDNRYDFGLKK